MLHGFKRTVTVTPSDTVDIVEPNDGFLVLSNGGCVVVPLAGSATITFAGLIAGTYIPMKIRRINAGGVTGTYATVHGQ